MSEQSIILRKAGQGIVEIIKIQTDDGTLHDVLSQHYATQERIDALFKAASEQGIYLLKPTLEATEFYAPNVTYRYSRELVETYLGYKNPLTSLLFHTGSPCQVFIYVKEQWFPMALPSFNESTLPQYENPRENFRKIITHLFPC